MRGWPLLDIAKTITECDLALRDLALYVTTLQEGSEGHYPLPADAAALLANAQAVRELLPLVIPPGMQADIAQEQAWESEEEDRWDASRH
jgi:hypothetical protein